jgi:RHS repeat-associated protein
MSDVRLGYSPVGNVNSRDVGSGSASLQYDTAYRLRQGISSDYTYDASGNRLTDSSASGGTWQYDADDRLTSNGVNTYEYNESGALVRKITPTLVWEYTYDPSGRLVQVTNGTDVIEYRYDPSGRRIAKIVNGAVTYFRHCAFGLCAEYDAAGNLTREYGYASDASFGSAPLYLRAGGQVYFYHADQLGTPLKLTDLTGSTVWAATYDDFGKATITVSQVESHLRLPGQYFDTETGLHYNWNRYYDPMTGRYVSSDPARSGGNYYVYASSCPLSYMDPEGLRAIKEFKELLDLYGRSTHETLDDWGTEQIAMGGEDMWTPRFWKYRTRAFIGAVFQSNFVPKDAMGFATQSVSVFTNYAKFLGAGAKLVISGASAVAADLNTQWGAVAGGSQSEANYWKTAAAAGTSLGATAIGNRGETLKNSRGAELGLVSDGVSRAGDLLIGNAWQKQLEESKP